MNMRGLLLAATLGTFAAVSGAADWPQWRGPHRDAIAPADGLLTDWPAGGPTKLWQTEAGKGYSAISVVGKTLVTMIQEGKGNADGKEVVVCWEDRGDSAKELWRYDYKSWFEQNGIGPRSTPTIDGNRVYTLGARGLLLCLDLKTGQRRWKGGLYGHGQVLLLADQPLLLVLTEEGEVVLVAANPDRHEELAKFPALKGKTWNHPILVGNRLYARNGEEAACFELALAGSP